MDFVLKIVCTALLVTSLVGYVDSQNCQNNFVTSLYQCLGNRTLDRENFLWVARNGSLGTEPSDVQAFTSRVCIEKPGLFLCIKAALDNALVLTEVQCPQTQKSSLIKLFKGIFKTLNNKCADPCRITFADDVTKCYTNQNLDPRRALLNITASRDAILGSDVADVSKFCQSLPPIVQCINQAVVRCNDSPILLRSYGLDVDQLNHTYYLLCNHTNVYQDAAMCFSNPSAELTSCRDTLTAQSTNLEIQHDDLNVTDVQYRDILCRIRVEEIQCEAGAIAARNTTSSCNDVVLGMRRQQECTLVPTECRLTNQRKLGRLCKTADFLIPERDSYRSGGTSVKVNWGVQAFLLSSCLLIGVSRLIGSGRD